MRPAVGAESTVTGVDFGDDVADQRHRRDIVEGEQIGAQAAWGGHLDRRWVPDMIG